MIVRSARPDDFTSPQSGRFIVIEDDQGVAAWGGVVYGGQWPEAVMESVRDVPRATLAKAARSFTSIFAQHEYVIARQGEQASAARFLEWLGFRPKGELDGKVLHKWIG